MTDPLRLLDDDANGVERALLEAGREDLPADGLGKARTLRALTGVGAVAALTTTTSLTAAAPGAAKTAVAAALAKWTIISVACVATVSGGVAIQQAVTASTPPGPLTTTRAPIKAPRTTAPIAIPKTVTEPALEVVPSVSASTDPVAPSVPAEPSTTALLSPPPPVAIATLPAAKHAPRPVTSAAPSPTSPTSSASPASSTPSAGSLGDEVALLEAARRALVGGDATDALATLDTYATKFPRGALSTEALVLRIQSLLARGDRNAAKSLAEGFLRAYPASPYAERVRRLIGIANP